MLAFRLPRRLLELSFVIASSLALAAGVFAQPITYAGASGASAQGGNVAAESIPGEIQFEAVPSPLPVAVDALDFAATGTAEFGDLIRLHGASHFVGRVAVVMSSGARWADFPDRSALGFVHPITLSLYAVDRSEGVPQTGELLARVTESFLIPWRLENPASGATARAFLLTFDLAPLGLALPSDIIYSISFNTRFHGPAPLDRPGPYDFLGIGLTASAVPIGADIDPNRVYWRSAHSGVLSLAAASGWAPFKPAVRFHDSVYGLLFETVVRLETLRGPDPRAAAGVSLAASLVALALDREFWAGNAQPSPQFGGQVFALLAEAADELTRVVGTPGAVGLEVHAALDALSQTTAYMAEAAVADAMIFGGDAHAILRAQTAAELAAENKSRADYGSAVDDYGAAWQEAQEALR